MVAAMSRTEPRSSASSLAFLGNRHLRVAVGCSLLLAACETSGGEKRPTKEQQDDVTETICDKRVECCSEYYDESNKDTCRATQGIVVNTYFNRVEAAVKRGNATFDAGEFETCAADLASASCAKWHGLESGDWPQACRAMVVGSLSNGESCDDHFDCASGRCDDQGVTGPAGTCQPRASESERCGAADEGCQVGLHCKRTADADYICAQSGLPGEACTEGSECDSNACVNDVCVAQCFVNWVAWPE